MANEKSSVEMSSTSADPVLLGVSMPVSLTKSRAGEVAVAWRECAMALVAAAKSKVLPEKKAESTQNSQNANQAPTISA